MVASLVPTWYPGHVRAYGEGSVSFDHRTTECKDSKRHQTCTGRWVGKYWHERKLHRVTAATKGECQKKLATLKDDLADGIVSSDGYTVAQAIADYLARGLPGRSPKTLRTYGDALNGLAKHLDGTLKKLTAGAVATALADYGEGRSTRSVTIAHQQLVRAIRFAEAHDKVRRNVAALIDTPEGTEDGRPSKSFTLDQAVAVLDASVDTELDGYLHLSTLTGVRPEEARALEWTELVLDGEQPAVFVIRAQRFRGKTKTVKSRRGLGLPQGVITSLKRHQALQEALRAAAGPLWEEHGLVFTDERGRALTKEAVLWKFRKLLAKVPDIVPKEWAPRELRHTFVSIMNDNGVTVEQIAPLVGHSSTATTEAVYRKLLRPVIQTGAEVMDNVVPLRRKVS